MDVQHSEDDNNDNVLQQSTIKSLRPLPDDDPVTSSTQLTGTTFSVLIKFNLYSTKLAFRLQFPKLLALVTNLHSQWQQSDNDSDLSNFRKTPVKKFSFFFLPCVVVATSQQSMGPDGVERHHHCHHLKMLRHRARQGWRV